jgi:hypothetical protein
MVRSTIRSLALTGGIVATALLGAIAVTYAGGGLFNNRSVGGVSISPEGVLEAPTVQDERELEQLRATTSLDVPTGLDEFTELRAVSLKRLEETIAQARANGQPVPAEANYLAGLQRVRYVFVYPNRQDIVLAGPAEGWEMDGLGNVVGITTGRPVLMLDDLLVALRSGRSSRVEPITCSIDPTPEGLERLQELASRLSNIGNPENTLAMIEEALGPQRVSVTGVPASSHFARTMVAADFRMKRIAMDFEQAPVDGLPSFLSMVPASGRGMNNMMPRWWLAPNYEPLAKTADSLAWELRGPGVKCLTEEDYVSETGEKEQSGKASPAASKWAASMTAKFSELADRDSSFGHLRNVMDLAVIGALIEKEQLVSLAGLNAPWLIDQEEIDRYSIPTQTSSKASVVRKRGAWVISASGGVEIVPWQIADATETVDAVGTVREELASDVAELWWE